MKKKALIFGVTGQDGAYLSKFLLSKNYEVHGVKRRSSTRNTQRIDDIYESNYKKKKTFFLHYGDITDSISVIKLINSIKPKEIYNLSAQSHVKTSFELPEYTANVDALGTLRILEAIRNSKLERKCKFYQASTSELFGKVREVPQKETTPFYPRSPYGVSKLFSYWITINYREAYNLFACNGILFNHESPLRGETFVTKKIISSLVRIKKGKDEILYLGNLNAKRDWGHAEDYVIAMWKMLQKKTPSDYVISTGKCYTVRDFIKKSAQKLNLSIYWRGKGLNEVGYTKNGKVIIKVDKKYFRPTEVDLLLGDSKKQEKS